MKYAVVTNHPNGKERSLLVRSWHDSEQAADDASVRLVTATAEEWNGVIPPNLSGLAIVREDNLRQLTGEEWTWASS